jgi:hypothetical protein
MKRAVTIFGLILGTLLAGNGIYMARLCYTNPEFQGNEVLGYAVMVVVFSFTFFGIKNYRDKDLGGNITFGQAFKTGALIALVGSTMYVVVWLFCYYLFMPDFIDQYSLHVLREATREGATAAELADKTKEMADFNEMYKNPLFVVLITYSEVLPVGLIVALVSSFILKRNSGLTVKN